MDQLHIVNHLPKEISIVTDMMINIGELLYKVSIGIDGMKEELFISSDIKQATLTHFNFVDLMEKLIKEHPLYPAEEIIERFKFIYQVAEAIKLLSSE